MPPVLGALFVGGEGWTIAPPPPPHAVRVNDARVGKIRFVLSFLRIIVGNHIVISDEKKANY